MVVGAERLPLLAPAAVAGTVAWSDGRAVGGAEFLAAVAHLAERLPEASWAVNLCRNRYAFALALAACAVRGVVTLLPGTRSAAVLTDLAQEHPGAIFLIDADDAGDDLPGRPWRVDTAARSGSARATEPPQIPADRVLVRMFTSGSTGRPQAQDKRWGSLWRNGCAQAARLAAEGLPPAALLGTVPAQHSYGFESTVLLAWVGAGAICAARPFYPADIAAELNALPRPRALVTTPFHLRTLLEACADLPAVDFLLSATAPLDADLARVAEARLRAPLLEIYGATECGQLATRRPTREAIWQTYDGVRIELDDDGRPWASGNYIERATLLGDCLELSAPERFRLLGRTADVVNVAGKRTSIAYLNRMLLAVPGVVDAACFVVDSGTAAGERVAAAVVAPGATTAALRRALRERLDPVFLPRPLLLLGALPRNEAGKLPRERLLALLEAPST